MQLHDLSCDHGLFSRVDLLWTILLSKFGMDNVSSTGEKVCVFQFFFSCSPLREKQTKERISRWETKVCCLHFRLEDLRKSFNGRAYVSTFPQGKAKLLL